MTRKFEPEGGHLISALKLILTTGSPIRQLFPATDISRETVNVAARDGVHLMTDVYRPPGQSAPVIAARTPYGGAFTGAVERENVMGVQFHPEKSAAVGLRVLRNFVEL